MIESEHEELKLAPVDEDEVVYPSADGTFPSGPAGYDGEVVRYEARGAIIDLWRCFEDEVCLAGPAGTGKSRGALERVHYLCANTPNMRALIARKTLVSLASTGLVTYNKHVLHRLDGVYFYGGSKNKAAAFKYPNGAELEVVGLDEVSRKMSGDYDLIFVQEANEITESDYEYMTTRLRNSVLRHEGLPYQQIIIDCNPQEPWHWIKRRAVRGDLKMYNSWHEDNPLLFNADGSMTDEGKPYMRRLDKLTGVRYKRLRLGLWAASEGAVYDMFDPKVHVIKPFKIPTEWTRIRSIDFGFQNPFVCQWWAVSPEYQMYLYREWYRTQTIVSEHAKRIKQLSGGLFFSSTVADHDSEDRATLAAAGIPTTPAKKKIAPGIEAVKERLGEGEKEPSLFIFNNALVNPEVDLAEHGKPTCSIEEFTAYSWAPETMGKTPKEVPLDIDNHAMDAARYAVMQMKRRYFAVMPGGGSDDGKSKWFNRHGSDGG